MSMTPAGWGVLAEPTYATSHDGVTMRLEPGTLLRITQAQVPGMPGTCEVKMDSRCMGALGLAGWTGFWYIASDALRFESVR